MAGLISVGGLIEYTKKRLKGRENSSEV
jgi:hypothetical protein